MNDPVAGPDPATAHSVDRSGALVGAAIGIMTLALLVGPWILNHSSIPAEIAIHWNLDGSADGSAPRWVGPLAPLSLWFLAWVPYWLLRRRAHAVVFMLPHATGISVFAALLSWLTFVANRGVVDWRAAGTISPVLVVLLIVLSLVSAVALVPLARRLAPPATSMLPPQGLPTGDPKTVGRWSSRIVAGPVLRSLSLILIVAAIVGAFLGMPLYISGVLFVAAGASSVLNSATVTTDERGIRVAFGPWGWPNKSVTLDRIAYARSIDVRPMNHGGWGYRLQSGESAIVLRAGEGIEVIVRDGRNLVVTVDDAERGAGILNDHLRVGGLLVDPPRDGPPSN